MSSHDLCLCGARRDGPRSRFAPGDETGDVDDRKASDDCEGPVVGALNRQSAVELLDRLHAAQNEHYGGGSGAALEQLLTSDITWHVPGSSPIAGTYRGRDEVFAYFRRRRDMAAGTFRMHRRDVLVGEGDRIAALTDGSATIRGVDHHWSTVGLYEITTERQVAACWLLPLDPDAFDRIWSS